MRIGWPIVLLLAVPVGRLFAQETGGTQPTTAPPVAAPSEAEIEQAMRADQAAKNQAGQPSPTGPPTATGAVAAPADVPSEAPPSGRLSRGFQSLNPDIAAIIDAAGGYYSDENRTVRSGDDPGKTGFNLQELEVALQSVVDPYFRADIFLTIPNLGTPEVEEAFLTTTHLPANLQLKAGIFRAGLGRQNGQHLHVQDFTRRPGINGAFLGVDGLRSPGVELNWLVPGLPFYLLFAGAAFSVDAADPDRPLQTFGGGDRYDLALVGTGKLFVPASESLSLYLGLNFARGKTSQRATLTMPAVGSSPMVLPTVYDNFYDYLYGADLYVKWKPPNVARSYVSVAWQSEYFVRDVPNLRLPDGTHHRQREGGLYSQVVLQVARRWYLGLRGELLGAPAGDNVQREYAAAGSVTLGLSEFSRIRLYGEARLPDAQPKNYAAFLQIEAAIGAHGAHPF